MTNQAILNLDKALFYNRNNAYIHLLLGRAYCLAGEYENAVQSLRSFIDNRPNNPLGFLELGFALDAACKSARASGLLTDESAQQISQCSLDSIDVPYIEAITRLGIDSDEMYSNADRDFLSRDYTQAYKWYSIGSTFDTQEEKSSVSPEEFKWSISAVLAGHPLPDQLRDSLKVHNLSEQVFIQAEDMRWLRSIPEWNIEYGTQVASYPFDDDRISILNWNGQIGAFLQVDRTDEYLISIRMQNMPPAPIKLQIEDNFIPLHQVETSLEDQSLQEFHFPAVFNSGLHLLTINFVNNGFDQGLDRDAYVDWIRIQEMADN